MKNQTAVYMGLFLMALALYGAEATKIPGVIRVAINKATQAEAPVDPNLKLSSLKLDRLFREISQNPLFSTHADGLKLIRNADNVTVRFYSDDVYAEGNFAVREIWYPLIDDLAKIISPQLDNGLSVEIRGYADRDSPSEVKPSDYGQSEYAFSFARAEWLARYFEKKWQITLHPQFKLVGMGAQQPGKMSEIIFSYPEERAATVTAPSPAFSASPGASP